MADSDIITAVQEANPVGTVCVLSDRTFKESPLYTWAERVSEEPVEVLEAFHVLLENLPSQYSMPVVGALFRLGDGIGKRQEVFTAAKRIR